MNYPCGFQQQPHSQEPQTMLLLETCGGQNPLTTTKSLSSFSFWNMYFTFQQIAGYIGTNKADNLVHWLEIIGGYKILWVKIKTGIQEGNLGRIQKRAFQQTLNTRKERLLQHYAGIHGIPSLILASYLPNNCFDCLSVLI